MIIITEAFCRQCGTRLRISDARHDSNDTGDLYLWISSKGKIARADALCKNTQSCEEARLEKARRDYSSARRGTDYR